MTTLKTGFVRGTIVELEGTVPELDGKRVRVALEPIDEPMVTAEQQRELWRLWVARGVQGPIEEGPDTEIP